MKTIWKHKIELESFVIEVPADAQLLKVDTQYEVPCLWIMLDSEKPKTERRFNVLGTGHEIPDGWQYIDSFQLLDGQFVGHLFEAKP